MVQSQAIFWTRLGCCRDFAAGRRSAPPCRRGVRHFRVCASFTDLPIMVNSCTGKMGHAAAEAVVRGGLNLVPYTITGDPVEKAQGNTIQVADKPVQVVGLEEREDRLLQLKEDYPGMLVVDFTLPMCVNDNGSLYSSLGLHFVMGTTGGDREKLMQDVQDSGVYAVIAPQMGKQVVAFQAMMQFLADNFPGCFAGYNLTVTESHQKTKVDTSGTAKAVVASLQELGPEFQLSDIQKVRDPEQSVSKMGVPESALRGHAYHTYHLDSPDGSVSFEFQHNVCGHIIYAEGTVDACLFLAGKIADGAEQKVYNMVDVLQGGSMR